MEETMSANDRVQTNFNRIEHYLKRNDLFEAFVPGGEWKPRLEDAIDIFTPTALEPFGVRDEAREHGRWTKAEDGGGWNESDGERWQALHGPRKELAIGRHFHRLPTAAILKHLSMVAGTAVMLIGCSH